VCLNSRPIDPESVLAPQFVRAIIRRVTARTGNPIFDEDLTQEALLRALKAVRRGTSIDHPGAFLEKIVHDLVCDYFRRPKLETPFLDVHEIGPPPHLEEEIDLRRRLQRLRTVLSSLPESARLIMDLFYTEEMSIRSIAGSLNCSPSAVKMALLRNRKRLRKLYGAMSS